jgi:uncharacterized Tic20 family protein
MIALLGLLLPALGGVIAPLFSWLNKKQDVTLAGAQAAIGADVNLSKEYLDAQIHAEQIKVVNNQWWGPKIIACAAGELSLIYYGSIVLDSMFHLEWKIATLPAPWDGYAWIILSSFIVVSPVAPVLSATAAWLGRK